MADFVYIVLGYANDNPAEPWGVMVFADERAAEAYRQEAAAASRRVIQNIKRATMIRGKPFPSEDIARLCASNKLDPNMVFSGAGVSYRILRTPLAAGLEIVANHSAVD